MAKHHPDLVFCRKQPGISLGRLCEKCDGKCVICDSYVRPHVLVHICDECNYGSFEGRCIICGAPGISDAYYCRECTLQEKDVSFSHQFELSIRFSFLIAGHSLVSFEITAIYHIILCSLILFLPLFICFLHPTLH